LLERGQIIPALTSLTARSARVPKYVSNAVPDAGRVYDYIARLETATKLH